MQPKLKLLANWNYARTDWVSLFDKLKDRFEITFIGEVIEGETKNVGDIGQVRYWSEYKNAFDIIDDIKPDRVIFMGLEGMLSVALNHACKKKGIPTFYLQHGMAHPLRTYIKGQLSATNSKPEGKNKLSVNSNLLNLRNFIFKFYLKTVGLNLEAIAYLLRFQLAKRKWIETIALCKVKSDIRIADTYIVYTKANADYLKERDGVKSQAMIPVGVPILDEYYNYSKGDKAVEPYFLLIDTPLVEVKTKEVHETKSVAPAMMNRFYSELADYAFAKGQRLYIKLHPFNYLSDFYVTHPNIIYLRETNNVELLMNSNGVFAFSSTLTLPAVLLKPFYLFRTNEEDSFINKMEAVGFPKIATFDKINIKDIYFEKLKNHPAAMEKFIAEYVYKADGKAVERIKEALSNKY